MGIDLGLKIKYVLNNIVLELHYYKVYKIIYNNLVFVIN